MKIANICAAAIATFTAQKVYTQWQAKPMTFSPLF